MRRDRGLSRTARARIRARLSSRSLLVLAASTLAAPAAVVSTQQPATAAPTPVVYQVPGGPFTYVVPAGVMALDVVAQGSSSGERDISSFASVARGAVVTTRIPVRPGDLLDVYV